MCSMLMTRLSWSLEIALAVLLRRDASFAPLQHNTAQMEKFVMRFGSETGRLCSVLSLQ